MPTPDGKVVTFGGDSLGDNNFELRDQSQQRFARRRDNQARAAYEAAPDPD